MSAGPVPAAPALAGAMPRGRHWRARRASGALVLVLTVVALGAANAAQLPLVADPLSAATVDHPCPGTASMVPANWQSGNSYRSVVLALPAGCGGLPVQLYFDRAGTSDDQSGTGTTDAAGVVSIRMSDPYDRTLTYNMRATVGGWNLPVAWDTTYMPPIWCTIIDASGATCTATVTLFHGNKPGGGEFDYYDVEITTTSPTPVEWEVGFNLAHPSYGTVPNTLGNSTLDGFYDNATNWTGDDADVERVSQCATYPSQLLVRGESHGSTNNYEDVRDTRIRRFSLVLNYQSGTYDDLVDANCSP